MAKVNILLWFLLLPLSAFGAMKPMTNAELSDVGGQAIGINLVDVSFISDIENVTGPASNKDTQTTELKITFDDPRESIALSRLYFLGGGKAGTTSAPNFVNRRNVIAGNGINVGTVDAPITLSLLSNLSTLLPNGSSTENGSRSALALCWTGTDCQSNFPDITNNTPQSSKADFGFKLNLMDTNTTPNGALNHVMWLEARGVRFEGESVPQPAVKSFFGLTPSAFGCSQQPNCDLGRDNGLDTPDTGDDYVLEAQSVMGGSWVALWADPDYGSSMAANIRISADELAWSTETLDAGGANERANFALVGENSATVRMTDVTIDLQLGHPYFQPVNIKTGRSYDPTSDTVRAEQVIEIQKVPVNPSFDPNQPLSTTNDPCGLACQKFYSVNTNLSDIKIGNLTAGDYNFGASYVQGLQIQYLRVATHDIAQ